MKTPLLACFLAVACTLSSADSAINQRVLGSGSPSNTGGVENAFQVLPGVYHSPQYLPHWPTAATLWPRVIDIECEDLKNCPAYNYAVAHGRAEYLFYRPVPVKAPVPLVNVTCEAPAPRIVLQEVACKGKGE